MCPRVGAHNTRRPWALGRADLARFGSSAAAWPLSRHAGWAGQGGSPTPHPGTPRLSQDAPTRALDSARATFFSRLVRIGTRDPVFHPFPIGLQPLESPADGFITPQTLRHALLVAHFRRLGPVSTPPWASHRCTATDAGQAGAGHICWGPASARRSWAGSIASASTPGRSSETP